MITIFVMGPTNSGKSTFLETISKGVIGVGLIEVGKILRAKYPPAYFKGLNNPEHTAKEAWGIYETTRAQHLAAGIQFCLVDGQPRDTKQLEAVLASGTPRSFLHLWAPLEIRRARAQNRDGHDPEKLKLSEARLVTDEGSNYNVLTRLLIARERVVTLDTSAPEYSCAAAFNAALRENP